MLNILRFKIPMMNLIYNSNIKVHNKEGNE